MILKNLIDEDFINYKKPSMVLGFPNCTFKCDKECGQQVCQNSALATAPDIDVGIKTIVHRYINNHITHSIVFQGLEPFDSWMDLWLTIVYLRVATKDDIVIYTGYNEDEIADKIEELKKFPNIIIKFGRFIPGQQPHYDEVLGVNLASDNQYARKVS